MSSRSIKRATFALAVTSVAMWLGRYVVYSDFARALPWSAVPKEQISDWGWDRFHWGRADVNAVEFQRLVQRLHLTPFQPGANSAEHFHLPHAADDPVTPAWFTPPPGLTGVYVHLDDQYLTIAKHEQGIVWFYRRYANWDL